VKAWGRGSEVSTALLLILALAFALRAALVLATPHFQPNNDPRDYDQIAIALAHGHGYPPTLLAAPGTPSALRPPGYPYLLAAVYAVVGHSFTAGRLMSAALGVIVVALVYLIGRRLWDRRIALVAAALAACFPPLIALNASLLSEPLFLVLELSVVLAVLAWRSTESGQLYAVAAGVGCGAAALTRSVGLLLTIAAAVGLLTAPAVPRGRRLTGVAVLLASMCVVIAPWTIRNASVFHGAFIPISTQDGITAAGTYNAQAAAPGWSHAVWRPPYFVPAFQHLFRDSIDEARMDSILRHDAVEFALAHPFYALTTTVYDSLRLLNIGPAHHLVSHLWYHEMGVAAGAEAWVSLSADVVIALAAVGSLVVLLRPAERRRRHTLFVWLVPLLMYASTVPIHGGVRYRAPLDPFFVLAAAWAIAAVWTVLERERRGVATPAAVR
jgi:4-amino-4-deoxy-L-arabinose transferase-like glycosyltransferase